MTIIYDFCRVLVIKLGLVESPPISGGWGSGFNSPAIRYRHLLLTEKELNQFYVCRCVRQHLGAP